MTNRPLGIAAITLAIAFNIPFSLLAARFDYPDILRQPAGEVLTAFAGGGEGLILIWYAFMLCAVALMGFAVAMAFAGADWSRRPGVAIGGALVGTLAGLTQAIGLSRWVFAVPELARAYADPAVTEAQRAALETGFVLMNQWGGVAIGEHLGQMLTLAWVALVAIGQWEGGRLVDRIGGAVALLAVAGIGLGLGDGLALAMGVGMPMFSMATVAGYLAFSVWLVVLGVGFLTGAKRRAGRVAA